MSVFRNLLMSINEESDLRHIQVGDNLYNKTIYYDIPDDFHIEMKQWVIATGNTQNYPRYIYASIFTPTNPYNAFTSHDLPSGSFMLYIAENTTVNDPIVQLVGVRYQSSINTIYEYTNRELISNLSSFIIQNTYANTPITWIDETNPAYKYTWVSKTEMGG